MLDGDTSGPGHCLWVCLSGHLRLCRLVDLAKRAGNSHESCIQRNQVYIVVAPLDASWIIFMALL